MPIFEIEGPDGATYEVDAPDEQRAVAAFKKHSAATAPASNVTAEDRASPLPTSLLSRGKAILDAATGGSQAGLMGGFDDEIAAGMLAPIDAAIDWAKGDGFDMGRAYTRKQQMLDEQKAVRREDHPIASGVGELAGGLALGGKAAQSGLTLAGRAIPGLSAAAPRTASVLAAGAEGAGYGALYGAGEAKPGERLEGAAEGAAIGAVTGAGLQTVGNTVSGLLTRRAERAAAKAAAIAGTGSKALKDTAGNLFDASEASGVRLKPDAVEKLGKRLKLALGRVNDKLRPKSAGYAEEIEQLFSGEMPLEDFEELRQVLGKEIKTATPNDARTLGSMKRVLDDFADNANSSHLIGDANAVKLLGKARETWARAKKTEIIEDVLDLANVKGDGQYTQSGMANAVRSKMSELYTQIVKGKQKGFNDAEVEMIRRMASGGDDSAAMKLIAKFAPRGVVSISLGQAFGSLFPGGHLIVPLAGAAAGVARDHAAVTAANNLLDAVANGTASLPKAAVINRKVAPFIGASTEASTGALRSREVSPRR